MPQTICVRGPVGNSRKRLLAEFAEGQVGAVPEIQHLEVIGAISSMFSMSLL